MFCELVKFDKYSLYVLGLSSIMIIYCGLIRIFSMKFPMYLLISNKIFWLNSEFFLMKKHKFNINVNYVCILTKILQAHTFLHCNIWWHTVKWHIIHMSKVNKIYKTNFHSRSHILWSHLDSWVICSVGVDSRFTHLHGIYVCLIVFADDEFEASTGGR